jgi:NhaP-type Na+/H+ or K+/H+ antiporter
MNLNYFWILVAIYLLCGCILYIYGSKLLAHIMKKTLAKRIASSISSVLTLGVLFLMTGAFNYYM